MDLTSHVSKNSIVRNNLGIRINMLKNRVTYIIRELVENYDAHPQYVDDVDWFFMPLVNPDGYEFTHTEVKISSQINRSILL